MDIFVDFAYISRYLQTNISAWKYLHNCQYSGVNESYFRKPLQSPAKNMKNNYPKTTHLFFTSPPIFKSVKSLNCYNFSIILTKLVKVHFLEAAFQSQRKSEKVTFLRPPSKK